MPGGGREFELRLYRDSLSTPWGFRLQGGRDLNAALTVQKVTPCTPAHGELEQGDVILEIQSNPASRLTHAQAKELIRNAGGSILLRLQRSGNVSYSAPAPAVSPSYTHIQRPVQRNVQRPINSDFGTDYNKPKYAAAAAKSAPQQYEIVGHYDYNQPTGLMLNRLQDSLNSSLRRSNSPISSSLTGYHDYPSPITPPAGHAKYPTWGGTSSPRKPSTPSQVPNNSAAPWRNNSSGTRAPGRIIAQTDFGGVVTDEPPAWLGSLRSSTNPQKSDAHPGVAAAAAAASLSGPTQAPTSSQVSSEGAFPHRPKVQGFHYGPDGSQEYRQGNGPQGPGDSARAGHLQYNSPLGLYSKQSVQEAMSSQLNGRPGAGTIGIRN